VQKLKDLIVEGGYKPGSVRGGHLSVQEIALLSTAAYLGPLAGPAGPFLALLRVGVATRKVAPTRRGLLPHGFTLACARGHRLSRFCGPIHRLAAPTC